MKGAFITFEGTEGGGKTTQIQLLAARLEQEGRVCRVLREPGGTPIGEEIRHTLKHSPNNAAMCAEAELLLLNASRAQIVREVIRPALEAGEIVLCDRFYDSTIAYQGYGRGLDLSIVRTIVDFAVGETRPHLTLLLAVPLAISEARRQARAAESGAVAVRDRFEEAGRDFFFRVEGGFQAIAGANPERIRLVDAAASIEEVREAIWNHTAALLRRLQNAETEEASELANS